MTQLDLVDLFADPIRQRLRQVTTHAEQVDRTQTDLRHAATTTSDWHHRMAARTTELTDHWHGTAAQRFAHHATDAQHRLNTVADALAAADTLVTGALGEVRTGHATIRGLLDEYTAQGTKMVAAARKLSNAGHPTAMIDATNFLVKLADRYATEADTAVTTAKQALVTATEDLAALDEALPTPQKHGAKHHHSDHTTTSGTTVDIGHGLGSVTAPNARAATAVRAALSQLGVPYVWGGESPGHAFDCSGLTAWAYGRAGISLPHFASSQRIGKKVSEQDLKPGDLVIFSGHVTMYIGKGQVVAAPHTGTDVQIEPLFTSIPGDPFLGCYRPSVRP
ncbi:MAG TPA: C40 family peptidase [Pseudonocardiaceae bacterium]|jgi:cell wall-associated NlpC family hydrolase